MIDLTEFKKTLQGKPVAVFGLGLSGLAVVEACANSGIPCHVWDNNPAKLEEAEKSGGIITNLTETDLSGFCFLVLAPGVPLYHPEPHSVVRKAREAGIEIIGDIEVFYRALQAHGGYDFKIVAITGTNGKSTTTALIGHILKENGIDCVIGGNIGVPVMKMSPPVKGGVVVLEVSSFQLDLCHEFRPHISVLCNMSSDHLDRHGTQEAYVEAKKRIFQNGSEHAVISVDDKYSLTICKELDEQDLITNSILKISLDNTVTEGVFVKDGILFDAVLEDKEVEVGKIINFTSLPGEHNYQNISLSYAVCRILNLESKQICDAISTFEGLPHRINKIAVINGISYVDDSKATSVEAAKRALVSFKKIYWIVGGRPKSDGLTGAEDFQDRVKHAFLIGEASEDFAKWFEKRGMPFSMCGTLDKALREAHDMAQSERGEPGGAGTVLLSPACASYDQYTSFEHRGEHFIELVQDLKKDAQG